MLLDRVRGDPGGGVRARDGASGDPGWGQSATCDGRARPPIGLPVLVASVTAAAVVVIVVVVVVERLQRVLQDQVAHRLAKEVSRTSPDALLAARRLVDLAPTHGLVAHLDAEAAQFAALWKSDTFRGRVSAFVDGSPARDR